MSAHTIKSYLHHLMRFDPATGKLRDSHPAVVSVRGLDLLLDEVHTDFILGTRAVQHGTTQEWVPVTYTKGLKHRQTMVPIEGIGPIAVQQ